jgi:hypothetical protein
MACFARNMNTMDMNKGMVQLLPAFLIPALYWPPPEGHLALSRMDPLHGRGDLQQIVPPVVLVLGRPKRHTAGGEQRRANLARVDRMLEYRRAYKHGGNMVGVVEGRRTRLVHGWERNV